MKLRFKIKIRELKPLWTFSSLLPLYWPRTKPNKGSFWKSEILYKLLNVLFPCQSLIKSMCNLCFCCSGAGEAGLVWPGTESRLVDWSHSLSLGHTHLLGPPAPDLRLWLRGLTITLLLIKHKTFFFNICTLSLWMTKSKFKNSHTIPAQYPSITFACFYSNH